jgi:hypothetical protein
MFHIGKLTRARGRQILNIKLQTSKKLQTSSHKFRAAQKAIRKSTADGH